MNRSIAITGIGATTPYGAGVDTLWKSLLQSRSAISEMDLFNLNGIACTKAGLIRNFTPPQGFEESPRATAFAAAACIEALQQAGIYGNSEELKQTALITASNFGNIDFGENALIPPKNPGYEANQSKHCAHSDTAAMLAEKLGINGLCLSLSLSCASGASAAVTAANLISSGRSKRVLIVGYDALSRFSWSGLCALRTMTKEIVRPFDSNRSGTIFSEGAGALVLEHSSASTTSLAFLTGWASGNNGHHMTAPAPLGAGSACVMDEAIRMTSLPISKIDHINSHGTGTKPNDITEAQAIETVFKEHSASIPVTSVKGSLGHMLGAAGSIEMIVSILSLQNNIIPPTTNLMEQDPECALDIVTTARELELTHVLSNSAGFGGCNAALVLSKIPLKSYCHKSRRVFIKGISLISALGSDNEETLAALEENESACFPLERFELPDTPEPPEAGEAPELDITDYGVSRKPYLDDNSRLFLCACGAAIQDAGYTAESLKTLDAGILSGTAWGCSSTQQLFFADFINKGPRLVKPFIFPHSYSNTPISLASMEWSLHGVHDNITNPHTASGAALIEAFDIIRTGQSQCILVTGSDALSIPRLQAETSGQPQGEAAATLILESSAENAKAEITGCGLAPDAGSAIELALQSAGLKPEDVTEALNIESLCGELAGSVTIANVAAVLICGLKEPTLIVSSERGCAVALIVKPI